MTEGELAGGLATQARSAMGGSQTSPQLNRGNLKQQLMRAQAVRGLGGACMTVRVNPYLSNEVFDTTFAHELLHYFGVPHNESTRHVGFSSNSLRRDLISKAVAKMLRE